MAMDPAAVIDQIERTFRCQASSGSQALRRRPWTARRFQAESDHRSPRGWWGRSLV